MKIVKKDYMNLIASVLNASAKLNDTSVYSVITIYEKLPKEGIDPTVLGYYDKTRETLYVLKYSKNENGEEEKDLVFSYSSLFSKKEVYSNYEMPNTIDPNIPFEDAYKVISDKLDTYPILKRMLDELISYEDKQITNDDIMDIVEKLTHKSKTRKRKSTD